MTAPKEIKRLVERFQENRDVYCSSAYNETQARREFIDPLFKALGWDVANEKGYAEAYKEVIHEDAIKVGGATKAPDYAFRIGGVRKFFVEAKRPGVNLKEDGDAAYQLRRYAWSAKLPLSILTDFEEFTVYDCRIKPARTDKASTGRVLYLTVDQYDEQWDEIASIFSQDAILTGSFDKYAESTKKKKGTAEVDTAFLKEIEAWRDVLARTIALRNTELSTRELNFAVQRTIDRIIFLRICEDRGIEEYGQLMALQNGTQIYKRLCQIFRRADERYNSGLFHFQREKERPEPPDGLTLNLAIDDKALKGILKELYYPESPYEFSVLPADILGQVYEQFLGKVIRLTPGHRAVVEDKPEVKKAGGVYYTPTYIVEYIVEHTVGKLLEGKTPNQVAKLRVLDPACGSGSFLLGAYQTLLDWHLKWYSENDPEKHAKGRQPKIFRGPGGDWRLTTSEKKRILLNNIYGVDIDPQAVEVTKLSLLLKVLEGENEETIGQSLRLFHERALPDLANNIKCGNSLIGPDFYEGKQLSLIDEEERYRINAFDWKAEFPHIFPSPHGRGQGEGSGFDAVIGNPPYVQVLHSRRQPELAYFSGHYVSASAFKKNLFPVFVERSLELVKNHGGRAAMIVPDRFFFTPSYVPCRKKLFERATLEEVLEILKGAFHNAIVGNAVFVASMPKKDKYAVQIKHVNGKLAVLINELPITSILTDPQHIVNLLMTKHAAEILQHCQSVSVPVKSLVSAHVGMMIRDNKSLFTLSQLSKQQAPIVKGRLIQRYCLVGTYFFDPSEAKIFGGTKDSTKHEVAPKILMRKTGDRLIACLDENGIYSEQSVYFLLPEPQLVLAFLLGLLNSRLLSYLFKSCFITNPIAYPYIQHYDLEKLPVFDTQRLQPSKNDYYDRLVKLVEGMLKLHKDLQTTKTDHEKSLIQRQIKETDKQIDQLVYKLYGLTDEEIRIVEETTK